MSRPALEVADIFRQHGPAYRAAHQSSLCYQQLRVMHFRHRLSENVAGPSVSCHQ